MIKAKISSTRQVQKSGYVQTEFDLSPGLLAADSDTLSELLIGQLQDSYNLDEVARHCADKRPESPIGKFFRFLNTGSELGVDLGGFRITVLDQRAAIQFLAEQRPDVFTDRVVRNLNPNHQDAYHDIYV